MYVCIARIQLLKYVVYIYVYIRDISVYIPRLSMYLCGNNLMAEKFMFNDIWFQKQLRTPPTHRCDRSPYTHTHTYMYRVVSVLWYIAHSQLEVFVLEIFRTQYDCVWLCACVSFVYSKSLCFSHGRRRWGGVERGGQGVSWGIRPAHSAHATPWHAHLHHPTTQSSFHCTSRSPTHLAHTLCLCLPSISSSIA